MGAGGVEHAFQAADARVGGAGLRGGEPTIEADGRAQGGVQGVLSLADRGERMLEDLLPGPFDGVGVGAERRGECAPPGRETARQKIGGGNEGGCLFRAKDRLSAAEHSERAVSGSGPGEHFLDGADGLGG